MPDTFVDVTVEIPLDRLVQEADPSEFVIVSMRDAADRLCDSAGGRVRTDYTPEIIVKRAVTPLGIDVLLCASRWAAVAPTSAL